jgi:hypothetical protein
MNRHDDTPPMRARIPADVDRPDSIAFNMTARQLLILAAAGLVLYAGWQTLLPLVAPLILLVVSIPLAAGAFTVAVGRRDGTSLDRWLLAALRHRRSPHQLVPAGHGKLIKAPGWVATNAGAGDRLMLPAPLRLPAKGVTAEGTVDLGPDGHTALVDCSTVNFTLRSPAEQNGLAAGFGRWLNSLDGPAQILITAQPVDLTSYATRLHEQAAWLPDPALEDAAHAHAEFLTELASHRELLHRRVTLAVRDRRSPTHARHRAGETAQALSGCEVTARVLDAAATVTTLAAHLDPAGRHHHQGGEPW